MTIRVLAKEDIPAVAALFRRVHPEHRGSSSEACESYFREMLFENPWRDPQVPYVGSRGERPHLRLLRSDGATDALPRTPDPRGGGLPVHGGLRLLADAWRHGAAAVRGRLEPRYAPELSLRHCWFQREGSWTLVHSRHADILAVIQQGDAFLSRLEGDGGSGGRTSTEVQAMEAFHQRRCEGGALRPPSAPPGLHVVFRPVLAPVDH